MFAFAQCGAAQIRIVKPNCTKKQNMFLTIINRKIAPTGPKSLVWQPWLSLAVGVAPPAAVGYAAAPAVASLGYAGAVAAPAVAAIH